MKKSSIKENRVSKENSGVLGAKKVKGTVKLMSINGLLPFLFFLSLPAAEAAGGNGLTILYIIVAVVVAAFAVVVTVVLIKSKKGAYDEKPEEE